MSDVSRGSGKRCGAGAAPLGEISGLQAPKQQFMRDRCNKTFYLAAASAQGGGTHFNH